MQLSDDAQATVEAIKRDGTNPETEKAHKHDMRFLNCWHRAKFGTALPLPTPVSTVVEAITWHLAPDAETDAVLVADGVKRWPGPAGNGDHRTPSGGSQCGP